MALNDSFGYFSVWVLFNSQVMFNSCKLQASFLSLPWSAPQSPEAKVYCCKTNYKVHFNPLRPKSDQHQFSLNCINK